MGSRQGYGADNLGPRPAISAAGGQTELHRDRITHARLRHRQHGCQADVGHSRRHAPARARTRLAPPSAEGHGRCGQSQGNGGPTARRPVVARGLLYRRGHDVRHSVRSDDTSAHRNPHARRRQHRRRFGFRSRARRLEGGRIGAGRDLALLSHQRHRSGEAELF